MNTGAVLSGTDRCPRERRFGRSPRSWSYLGTAVVLAGWLVLQVVAAWIAAHPTPRAEPTEPPAATCWERVATTTGEAWWCPGDAPAVVVVHGYGGTRTSMLPLATAIHDRTGHAVLLPRLTYTDGSSPYSGGARESATVAAALRFVQDRTGAPGVALGVSAGGNATVRAVAEGAPASAVIVDSSFADSAAVFEAGASRVGHLPTWAWSGMHIAFPFVSDGGSLASTDLTACNTSTLAITCHEDDVVPSSSQRDLIAGTTAREWAAPCAEHASAWDNAPGEYVDRVAAQLRH